MRVIIKTIFKSLKLIFIPLRSQFERSVKDFIKFHIKISLRPDLSYLGSVLRLKVRKIENEKIILRFLFQNRDKRKEMKNQNIIIG